MSATSTRWRVGSRALSGAVLAAMLGVGGEAAAQGIRGPMDPPPFDVDAVDAVFADYSDTRTPGCALGVIVDGELVYGRGYGMANLELGVPISTRTVFRTGSVSKQFTAAVVAIAAMDGHLSLDDELRRWIPELPDYGTPLTIRHALHHTSGLRDYLVLMDLRGLRGDDWYDGADLLAVQSRQEELNFPPGSEYLYSNSGYYLLTVAVERAVEKPFKVYAEEVLFGPLGMASSHFHDDHDHLVPDRADGYRPAGHRGFETSMTTLDMIGDGGVYSSIEDMAKWVTALERDALRPDLNAVLERRGVLTSGEEIPYALGQAHGEYRGVRSIGHGGSFVGFRADVTRFPTARTSIVTLCNRADADPTRRARGVADVVLADRLGPRPPERERTQDRGGSGLRAYGIDDKEAYVGTYFSPELDVEYHFEISDDLLRVRAGPGLREDVHRLEGDTLASGNTTDAGDFVPSLTYRFQREGGRVVGFELDAGRVVHVRFRRR